MSETTPATGKETVEQALTRAQAATQAKRFGEANGICEDVLATTPEHPSALALQGVIAAHSGHPDRAVGLLERALARHPGVASWHANLCSLYRILNRVDEAVAAGREAVRLAPDNPDNLVNLSLAFSDLDDRDNAVACLLRAIGLNPAHADARLAMAQNLLARGDFDAGWIEYEWRNETEAGKNQLPRITSAPWNGMAIPNGRILLIGDQGYGDTLQFCRYIPMVAERCREVVLGCSGEMAPLLARLPGVAQCHHKWNEIPGHAAHTRLSSLPWLFRTTEPTIPSAVPYLAAEPERRERWRARLDELAPRPTLRVGLAWSGRPTHPNDRRRSVRLGQLLPLAEIPGVSFVSLQKPFPERDREAAGAFRGLADQSEALADFEETAAAITGLDLIVTVDTSMGHLAGALGVPVWIMLAKAADWRWLLDREDSPWYPSVRLFRQERPGEWPALVEKVAQALRIRAA